MENHNVDYITENYDIQEIEYMDNKSHEWESTWTNRFGDLVFEKGNGWEQLLRSIDFSTNNSNAKYFRLMLGGAMRP